MSQKPQDELTAALLEELAAAEASIQRAIRTLAAIYSTDNPTTLERVRALYEMERVTEPVNPAEENKMKRTSIVSFLVIVLLALLIGGSVLAQDETAEPLPTLLAEPVVIETAEAPVVVQPPVVVIEQREDADFWDRFTTMPDWAINGFLVVIGLMGIGFVVLAVHAISSSNRSYPPGTGAAIERLVTSIDERSQQTATTLDDFLMHILKPLLESGIGAIKEREGRLVITPELAEEIKSRAASAAPFSRNVGVPLEQHLPLDAPPERPPYHDDSAFG